MSQFASLRQGGEETVEEFADRVEGLAIRAFPKTSQEGLERQAILKFVDGLGDGEAAVHLACANLGTLAEAVRGCVTFQAANAKYRRGRLPERPLWEGKEGGVVRAMNRDSKSPGRRMGSKSPGRATAACFRCGSFLHWVPECPFETNVCFLCYSPDHELAKCPKRGGKAEEEERAAGKLKKVREVVFTQDKVTEN